MRRDYPKEWTIGGVPPLVALTGGGERGQRPLRCQGRTDLVAQRQCDLQTSGVDVLG